MPTLLILQNPDDINPDQLKAIRELAPGYDVWSTKDPVNENADRLADVEISTGFKPPQELILNGRLKWHHAFSAGMDWMFEIEGYRDLPTVYTNSSGIHGPCISEHTFAMILAFDRGFVRFIQLQKKGIWGGMGPGAKLQTLPGNTMLILGVGSIGQRIARIAKAHDMYVIGIRRQPDQGHECVDEMFGQDDLDNLLPRADYIVSVLPNTPDTRHILGAPQFERMKSNAFVVNVGRGVHIDENALAEALSTGKIRGAGLDTFETEPLPESSLLWDLDNVIISPHTGGSQPDYTFEARKLFIENLEKFMQGQPLKNVVDKDLGYSLTH